MLQINQGSIDTACTRMDAWADSLREHVATQASQVKAQIDGMTDFQGQAATAFRTKFDEMTTQIRTAIENISNQQIGGLRTQLNQIARTMMDTDGQVASGIQ